MQEPEEHEKDQKQPSQVEILTEIAARAEVFHTRDGTAFATVKVDGHKETWRVRSKPFKQWLVASFYSSQKKPPNSEARNAVLGLVEAWAQHEGKERTAYVRVAEGANSVYIDRGSREWDAIRIDSSGWHVVPKPGVKFHRTVRTARLPKPLAGGDVTALRSFINLSSEQDLVLVVAWLIGALRPTGPYPILILQGEQGSAKSTTARMLRSLVDPSTPALRTGPRSEHDLMIAASQSWVLAFDNLSGMQPWLSDALCRLATGGGFATRELYTDADEIIFEAQRPVILNGIEDLASRQDLADRAIVVTLPAIPEEKRQTEKSLRIAFKVAKPKILGALYDAISAALLNVDSVELPSSPRMADFAEWMSAAESALPWPEGAFLEAYSANREEAIAVALENDIVASAVGQLLKKREAWEGTATELLVELRNHSSSRVLKSRAWPKSAKGLSGKLKRAATFLRSAGVEVEFYRESGKNSRRMISLCAGGRSCDRFVANVACVAKVPSGPVDPGLTGATNPAHEKADATQRPVDSSHSEAPEYAACDECDACDEYVANFTTDPEVMAL